MTKLHLTLPENRTVEGKLSLWMEWGFLNEDAAIQIVQLKKHWKPNKHWSLISTYKKNHYYNISKLIIIIILNKKKKGIIKLKLH